MIKRYNYFHIFTWSGMCLLCMASLMGCEYSRHKGVSHPTNPVDFASGRLMPRANFDDYGAYSEGGIFLIKMPAGDYLLEYTTTIGTFYLVFRASQTSIYTIGLQPGDHVNHAVLYRGTITSTDAGIQDGTVTIFLKPGDAGTWEQVFSKEPESPGLTMVGGVSVHYVPGQVFDLHISKAGTYLLTYITTIGKFEHEFEITENNSVYPIGLMPGDTVIEAYILKKE